MMCLRSSVSIMTRLRDGRPGFNYRQERDIFLFATASGPPLQNTASPEPGVLSVRVKWPGHEAHHSTPSGAEVRNAWNYTSTLPYVFMACCLVKHRDSFTLYLSSFRARKAASVRRIRNASLGIVTYISDLCDFGEMRNTFRSQI
jgi:hypothetical protein